MATRYHALVFDFDGTIADTLHPAMRILNQLAERYKFKPLAAADLPKAQDMSTSELIRFLKIPRLKLPGILLEGRKLLGAEIDTIQPITGLPEVLEKLRQQTEFMGIVTSNSKLNVQNFLRRHNLGQFAFISSVSKLGGKHKHLKAILRTFTLEKDDILYIGDESRDIKAAHKAGVAACGVTWGYNSSKALRSKKPDYLFSQPRELLTLPMFRR
ncbi:MAG: HAD-IA family hydrolase [Verrucomicrobiota bacterium]|nr:HAD-IA family hydrolase [Verrucomicrobiota bacterium]